jgi:hypothetical protein
MLYTLLLVIIGLLIRDAMKHFLKLSGLVLSVSVIAGCQQVPASPADKNYKVISSETFLHHYAQGEWPDTPRCKGFGVQKCELTETRFFFVHDGVKTVANCQSWDATNSCSLLRVGQSYDCEHSEHPETYGNMLNCTDISGQNASYKGALDIEKEETMK